MDNALPRLGACTSIGFYYSASVGSTSHEETSLPFSRTDFSALSSYCPNNYGSNYQLIKFQGIMQPVLLNEPGLATIWQGTDNDGELYYCCRTN